MPTTGTHAYNCHLGLQLGVYSLFLSDLDFIMIMILYNPILIYDSRFDVESINMKFLPI